MEPFFIYRSALDKMAKNVIDKNTGLTELDEFELTHNLARVYVVEDTSDDRDKNGCLKLTSYFD